jgi:tRNA (mo5U34)-methyltransferase
VKLLNTAAKDEVRKQVEALGVWHQHFRLPNGVQTGADPKLGYDAEHRWSFIEPYVAKDLRGKTVLDIGGNAGFFSIQMKLRGAERCIMVDPYVECIKQASFAAAQFAVQLELVNEDAHTYCLTTDERFDYVLFLGLLYHLKYPGLVLDRLAEMTRERIFVLSAIAGKKVKMNRTHPEADAALDDPRFPKLAFIEDRYKDDLTNWWIPNYTALAAMVRSAGLRIVDRPHPQLIVAEPEVYFGKVVFSKLVFPRYGKRGNAILPDPQMHDPAHWAELARESRLRGAEQRKKLLWRLFRAIKKRLVRGYCSLRARFVLWSR